MEDDRLVPVESTSVTPDVVTSVIAGSTIVRATAVHHELAQRIGYSSDAVLSEALHPATGGVSPRTARRLARIAARQPFATSAHEDAAAAPAIEVTAE